MRVLSSMATKALLTDLLDGIAEMESGGGVLIADRVRDGVPGDVVVLAEGALRRLADEGHVDAATITPLFVSEVVVAVRDGEPAPVLTTTDALRTLLLAADRIGYSTGPSGDGLLRMLGEWSVRDAVQDRLIQAPAGVPVARLLADGKVSVGVQQRSEFTGVQGVQVVGALPPGSELTTLFAGAVIEASPDPRGARRLLSELASPAAAETIRRHGMEPA